MIRRIAGLVLCAASVAAAWPAVARLRVYYLDEEYGQRMLQDHGWSDERWPTIFFAIAGAQAAVFLLGYLVALDPRAKRRPWPEIAIGPMGAGFVAGGALHTWTQFGIESGFWLSAVGGALLLSCLMLGVEFALRSGSQALVRRFDKMNKGGAALAAGRLALLWRSGQEELLRSVMLERWRRGVRGDLPDRLRALFEAGDRDPELLQALCQVANQESRPDEFLRYLRELHAQFPGDEELRDALLQELLEQGKRPEALKLIEDHGVPATLEGFEAHGQLLLEAGRLEEAVQAARRLGEMEGIPLRRSDALLRKVLSTEEDNLAALNALAEHAQRLARKDQLARWLLRSFEVEPRQHEVRARLIEQLEEQGQSQTLERVLATANGNDPGDHALAAHYAAVLEANGKAAEALAMVEKVADAGALDDEGRLRRARLLFELERVEEAADQARAALEAKPSEAVEPKLQELLRRIERAQLTVELADIVADARNAPDDLDLQVSVLERLCEPHPDRAVVLAEEVLRRHPSARPRVRRVFEHYAEDHPKGGFQILNSLADIQVADSDYDAALKTILRMSGNSLDPFGVLRDGAQKILRRSPHHLPTLRTLGQNYRRMGQFTEMIHSYALYLANGGEETEDINEAMAAAYLALEDYDSARRFIKPLIERPMPEDETAAAFLRDQNRELVEKLIPLGISSGRAEDAAEFMKRLEVLGAGRKETRELRAAVNEALGEQRLSFLKRELDSGKGDGSTLEEIGDLCRDAEDFNQAITYYQRAARQAGSSRAPVAKLAYCFARKRMFDTAGETLGELKLSLQDDPEELEQLMVWIYRTAEAFEEARLFDNALRIYKQLLKVDAGYKDVLDKVERLGTR